MSVVPLPDPSPLPSGHLAWYWSCWPSRWRSWCGTSTSIHGGRFFVSGVFDGDRELQVASLKDGHRLGTLMVFGDFQWLFFTPDLLRQTLHLDAAPVAVPGAAMPVR